MADAVVRVLRGNPDDTELAALVAVLLLTRSAGPEIPAPRSPWGDPAYAPDAPLWPGESAWRLSGLPY